jgi:hypothetical protein
MYILVQLQHLFLPSLIVTSSQVRVGTPLPLPSWCIPGVGPKGLGHNCMIPCKPSRKPSSIFLLRVTLVSWGNSAYENSSRQSSMAKMLSLQDALQRCSTRKRNRWHHHAPTRTRFFLFTSNAFLRRPVSIQYWLLHPFFSRKPHARAVPSMGYSTHMKP